MKQRILIADDEPNIVISLEFLLQRAGFETRVARDGEEALRLADSFRPHAVLLDVMMPAHSGFEVCRRMRATDGLKDVKVIMLTARGGDAEIDRGLRAGADAYVTKPFATAELLERVRALLGAGEEAPR